MLINPTTISEQTPIKRLDSVLLREKGINVWVKEDYLTHPFISGNKWRKLKYNLAEAKRQNAKTLLTFGGAYSNHIYAVAAAGNAFGFKTIGIIRGEEHLPLNHTLSFARECGMEIHYLDRSSYRKKNEDNYLASLYDRFGEVYIIPEGGTNAFALQGCQEMVTEITLDFDYLCLACGTAGTLAGSILGLKAGQKALGFSALKGKDFLETEVENLIGSHYDNWSIHWGYHFGGYAKTKKALLDFMEDFEANFSIRLEPIYTAKLFFGIFDLIEKDYFKEGTTLVAVHTGGLQGRTVE